MLNSMFFFPTTTLFCGEMKNIDPQQRVKIYPSIFSTPPFKPS